MDKDAGIRSFLRGKPRAVFLETTWECQNACEFCDHANRQLPPERANPLNCVTVTESVITQGITRITFSGGEPLLDENLLEAARVAKRALRITTLLTNGACIDSWMARALANSFDVVQVAIQSPDEEVHDTIVGRQGAFTETVRGFNHLVAAGVPTVASVAVSRSNVATLQQMPRFLRGLGVTTFLLNRVRPQPGKPDTLTMKGKEYSQAAGQVWDECQALGLNLFFLGGLPIRLYRSERWSSHARPCGLGTETLTVSPDGKVRPCLFLDQPLGDYTNLEDAFQELLRNRDNWIPDICRPCRLVEQCRGGCRGAAFSVTGDLTSIDPMCPRAHALAGDSEKMSHRGGEREQGDCF